MGILAFCSGSGSFSISLKSPARLSAVEVACYDKKSQEKRSEHACKVHDEFSEWSHFPHNNKYFYNL